MKSRCALIALTLLTLTGFALAQTLEGTVTNGTTGKPAAGTEVTLLSLANGMSEAGHTKTDSKGRFSFTLPSDGGMPHLVRATHQDVNYFKMAPPGSSSADVQVYDAAKKLEGISTSVQIMRLQSSGGNLQVVELYAVQNSSQPARTLMADRTFDIALPHGAVINEAAAKAPNGQPITTMPSPIAGKPDQYSFNFPVRPGETQFQVAYELPYTGQATIKPTLLHDVQHFVALLPKTMQFSPAGPSKFSSMPDDSGTNVQVVTNAKAGQDVAFTVSGTGLLADENPSDSQTSAAQAGPATGPGGGLGAPIGSPDPLSQYRWPLLGALGVIMVAGGFYVVSHRAPGFAEANAGPSASTLAASATSASAPRPDATSPRDRSAVLLEAMKEELFQLEIERQQGRISEPEYQKSKAALDETIKRAIARR